MKTKAEETIKVFYRSQYLKDKYRFNTYKTDYRFVIKDGRKHKCAIICPGGGYGMICSCTEGVPVAKTLNRLGISAVIVYYHVRNRAKFPSPMNDLARAVAEVFRNKDKYNLDMSDYSVWGFSAGGHLASSFGTTSLGYPKYNLPKPDCLVLGYPVISMDKSITHMGTHDNLLGKAADAQAEKETSINLLVDSTYPRTYIWCGNTDELVSNQNTILLSRSLEANKIQHECKIFDKVGHGAGIGTGTNAEGWMDKAVSFWLKKCC